MNEDLTIEILKIIKVEQIFSANDIYKKVIEIPEFINTKQIDFKTTWEALRANRCLVEHEDKFNHKGHLKLNPDKDCLAMYSEKQQKRKSKERQDEITQRRKNWAERNWLLADVIKIFIGGLFGAATTLAVQAIQKESQLKQDKKIIHPSAQFQIDTVKAK